MKKIKRYIIKINLRKQMEPYKKENSIQKNQTGRWSREEHQRFMLGIMTYGKDWKRVQKLVGTRNGSQVRSHAQKFFNKIQKQQQLGEQKQIQSLLTVPKTPQKFGDLQFNDISGSQIEISKFNEDQVSEINPSSLISIIRKQSTQKKQINLEDLKKQLEQKIKLQKQKQDYEIKKDSPASKNKLSRANSYKGMSNIISAYQNLQQSDQPKSNTNKIANQSFLIRLAKKYEKFFNQGNFQSLIDFGNQKQKQQPEIEIINVRKKSFTLPQGVQGDEQDLNERKKRIISQSTTNSLSTTQKQSFKAKMKQINEDSTIKKQQAAIQTKQIS